MQARDLMSSPLVSVREEDTVRCLLDVLHERRLPSVPVLDSEGRPVGTVTQSDVLRALDRENPREDPSRIPPEDATALRLMAAHAARSVRVYGEGDPSISDRRVLALLGRPVRDVMTRQVTVVDEELTYDELADMLVRSGSHRIVVTRDGIATGIITASEVLRIAIAATPMAVANSF
ncbi:MAG TPA: CBS domain-containing protein [Planctomycetota bacterium]|nr:CBS domain-containing protein [Planctomycetota bacterium]